MKKIDNILIVDDDFMVLDHLRNVLLNENRNISFVTKADFALLRIEKEQFDLLLLDVNMPGINGIELLKQIRKKENYKDVPVIMITGESDTSVFVECFNNGANDYIVKPINVVILNARVNAALSSSKQAIDNIKKSKQLSEVQIKLERQSSIQHQLRSLVSRMNPHFIFNAFLSMRNKIPKIFS